MSKNQDSRQVEHRSTLDRLSDLEKPTLKQLLPEINRELTPVFELRASSVPDLTLNIGSGSITNSDTGLKRSFSPIDGQFFDYSGGTIVFPAADGGTITIAGGIDSTLVMADDTFMTVLAQINSIGELSVAQGVAQAVEADTLLAANFPVPNSGELPLGYITLQNIAGVVQVIENEKIVQFESGGGGSGSGDAVGFESEMDDYLDDSFFEYYEPIIFKRDKEDKVDPSSTGDFKNAEGVYQLEIGEVFESTNLFDVVFIADNIKSLQQDLVVDYFDDASRDDGATYELSIDAGVTYEAITMVRQEGTTRYIGRLRLSDNATYDDLRVRITASEVETKLSNIAVFYNEIPNGAIGGIKQTQTFTINGDDDTTDFLMTVFLPDPTLTKMYVEETGQVFKGSALTFNGFTVSVPTGTFDAPGEVFTITIEQLEGSSFDNSDQNASAIAVLQNNSAQVGDVVQSMLTEAQFQALRDTNWILMDGRDVTGSTFATLTGNSTVPDARGQHIRGKNNGRSDGQENPDGDLALGTQQTDEFKSHGHTTGEGGFESSQINNGYGYVSGGTLTNRLSQTTSSTGGNETRPKNITLNIFIKIN